ncbi:MAG: acetate--CoA ligase family protein [Betaproteobacteria bacterium]|nr:acetate--CoA ligase family protein [Betaproteobacteria bacterium]
MTATTDWTRFYSPRSVAVVGATDDTRRFGGRLMRQMRKFGYPGRVLAVNPKRTELNGEPCYPNVSALPEVPDHVGIVVPAERVLDVLRECHAIGVRCATVFSAGFAETGTERGIQLQNELTQFAQESGLRVMGPNCNGPVNFVDRFSMTGGFAVSNLTQPAGNVGLVSQSGGLGQTNIMWRAVKAGVHMSYQASCGNEADLSVIDFARFMIEGERTDVVMMALEAVRDGAQFLELAQLAAEREKPLIVLKFGLTDAGRRAAASHTGAITGSDDVFSAVCDQFGVIRVQDCNELYERAIVLRNKRLPKGRRAASMSLSGGNVVQMADVGTHLGLSWENYTATTDARLAELIPGYGKVGNPTDMTSLATGQPEIFRKALEIITEDANVDVMMPVFTFTNKADLEHAAALSRDGTKPLVMLLTGGCNDDETLNVDVLVAKGAAAYRNTVDGLKAVCAAIAYREFLDQRRAQPAPVRPAGVNVAAVAAKLKAAAAGALSERVSKSLLADYGLPVPAEHLAASADEAVAHARAIGGAVALKVESPDIAHKTEAGAIRLGLTTEQEVRIAYALVVDAAQRYKSDARISGVLVQEMVPAGVEMMIGVVRDPVFGPILAVALGGIYVEVLRDVTYRVPPVTASDARDMLRELRGYRMLEGVRGKPAADIDALVDCIVRCSWFAHDHGAHIAELDVNPLMVLERGLRVVDALLIRSAAAGDSAG